MPPDGMQTANIINGWHLTLDLTSNFTSDSRTADYWNESSGCVIPLDVLKFLCCEFVSTKRLIKHFVENWFVSRLVDDLSNCFSLFSKDLN